MIDRNEWSASRQRWILTAAGAAALSLLLLALGACGSEREKHYRSVPGTASVEVAIPAASPPAEANPAAASPGPLSVSVGMGHGCAIAADGRAWCWGGNEGGQLGAVPDSESSSTTVAVDATASFTAVAAGGAHSCALAKDGAAWCWGSNAEGQLGDGTTTSRARAAAVGGTARFKAIAAGISHSCALDVDGAAWCWGANQVGQLGTGGTSPSRTPARVAGDARFRVIAAPPPVVSRRMAACGAGVRARSDAPTWAPRCGHRGPSR